MQQLDYDIVFVGGGLVNGLLAWQLKRIKPWLNFIVLEQGSSLGGRHTWSFHEEDVPVSALNWLGPLISASWPYYQVAFPQHERQVESRYFSIRSRKFHEVLFKDLGDHIRFHTEVISVSKNQVVARDGASFSAKWVIDGRGTPEIEKGACGFQKFFGLEIETVHPHGLRAPILMDATVQQVDGYRFLYCLPWNDNRLLVEDTRYSDNPNLDSEKLRQSVLDYCASRNWMVKEVFYEESGCLPLPLTKKFFHGKRSAEDLQETPLTLGMRAGLCHPTTGYSFPMAVKTVEVLLNTHLEEEWSHELEKLRRIILRDQKFFMLLNRVMFLATSPNQRFRFLQHFYRLPEDIISGFYAHRLTVWDKARFFMRTPPVPVFSAVHAMKQEALHGI